VDGGLASELPAREARMIAAPDQFVVAVNVGARPSPEEEPANVLAMVDWATRIKALYLRRYEKQCADVLIEPLVGFTQWHDFSNPDAEIEKGREAGRAMAPEILRRLGR
jgi:NTE family protein